MKTGLVSVTFRNFSTKEIIDLALKAGLDGIEWGSDIHVPPNNLKNAREVLSGMQGLEVLSYGSYYRLAQEQNFDEYLETALELKAKNIRVWAGEKNSEDSDETYWDLAVQDAKNIAQKAGRYGIDISFEYHGKSLTNTQASTIKLLNAIDEKNVFTYWQPLYDRPLEENLSDIKQLSDMKRLKNLHVFHWVSGERFLLEEGSDLWGNYLSSCDAECCILEFVKDDEPENFLRDAKTLLKLLKNTSSYGNSR